MDVYDKAVKYLTEHPEGIQQAWSDGYIWNYKMMHRDHLPPHLCSFLFRSHTIGGTTGNCFTMIRRYQVNKTDPELVQQIHSDLRLPNDPYKITPEDLPVFAEWHRRLDKELNREVPIWRGPDMEDAVTEPTTQG